MSDDQRAREFLAAEYEAINWPLQAQVARELQKLSDVIQTEVDVMPL